jgi:signal transduction histidine kinase/EAL domain-containing protein (putative c-di-GMP-specific phosphodiesterase class I)
VDAAAPDPGAAARPETRRGAAPDPPPRAYRGPLRTSGAITSALDPILRLSDEAVIGYEALPCLRPAANLATPATSSAWPTAHRERSALDLACVEAALRSARHLGGADLFVGVLIRTLLDGAGLAAVDQAVRRARLRPSGVVLQVSEHEVIRDPCRAQRAAAELRGRGYRIAMGGAGIRSASLRLIADLRPDFVKVDESISRTIDLDEALRAGVASLLSASREIGSQLVAEGVETVAQRSALESLGVQLGQGRALAIPVPPPAVPGRPDFEVLDVTRVAHRKVAIIGRTAAAVRASEDSLSPEGDAPRRRDSLARALSHAAMALQNEHDPMRILSVMFDQMAGVVPVKDMAIYVADHKTHRLVPVLASGHEREAILASATSMDAGMTGWALAEGAPQNVPNAWANPHRRWIPGTPHEPQSVLLAPLVAGDRKLGVIVCWRSGLGRFTARDLEAASLFAHIAASAWRNAQLYYKLQDTVRELTRIDGQRMALLAHLVKAQEEERHRIAADLHDDVVQLLAAVNLRLQILRNGSEALQHRNFEAIQELIAHASGRLRALLFQLHPPALEQHGLVAAIRAELERLAEGCGMHPELRSAIDREPEPSARTVIFRIAQEALQNVRKHSGAASVEVEIRTAEDGTWVRIRDDGRGFSPPDASAAPTGHMGLRVMEERARLAGGWWRIDRVAHGGTAVEFWVPGLVPAPAGAARSQEPHSVEASR